MGCGMESYDLNAMGVISSAIILKKIWGTV